jgi:hypothetical protein
MLCFGWAATTPATGIRPGGAAAEPPHQSLGRGLPRTLPDRISRRCLQMGVAAAPFGCLPSRWCRRPHGSWEPGPNRWGTKLDGAVTPIWRCSWASSALEDESGQREHRVG